MGADGDRSERSPLSSLSLLVLPIALADQLASSLIAAAVDGEAASAVISYESIGCFPVFRLWLRARLTLGGPAHPLRSEAVSATRVYKYT